MQPRLLVQAATRCKGAAAPPARGHATVARHARLPQIDLCKVDLCNAALEQTPRVTWLATGDCTAQSRRWIGSRPLAPGRAARAFTFSWGKQRWACIARQPVARALLVGCHARQDPLRCAAVLLSAGLGRFRLACPPRSAAWDCRREGQIQVSLPPWNLAHQLPRHPCVAAILCLVNNSRIQALAARSQRLRLLGSTSLRRCIAVAGLVARVDAEFPKTCPSM
ncbi:MAG: hypothetical protein ACI9SE_004410 [Neolewinella sp.]|jgi:hypothetical protein